MVIPFHPLGGGGGGVLSSAVDHTLDRVSEKIEEDESDKTKEESDGPENDDGSSEIAIGPGCITHETDMRGEPPQTEREEVVPQLEEDIIPQPIPFQMGITPQEDSPPGDELTDWYDDTRTSDARGSTDVSPNAKSKSKGNCEKRKIST